MDDPGRIIVAGDWHGNTRWAVHVIRMAPQLLAGEAQPLILHLGDFGIWPGTAGRAYREQVQEACRDHGVVVWFLDGNHEDFTQISRHSVRRENRWGQQGMYWLPRNTRWKWHGRQWHALGGAASVDKAVRKPGASWWPEEEITERQARWAREAGPADVLVTHDCPSGVRHSFAAPPRFWAPEDLARSDAHRERLQRVVNALRPRWIMHGHLHRAYTRDCDFGYGPVEVTGLDCAGGDGPNYVVLDTRSMTWEVPDEPVGE